MAQEQEIHKAPEHFKFSCASAIDALWFCYSPVNQVRAYYREGALDNCSNKFSDVYECFRLKTKPLAEAKRVIESRQATKGGPQFWELRTREEAAQAWNQQFGYEEP